jgi:hypothetical protein
MSAMNIHHPPGDEAPPAKNTKGSGYTKLKISKGERLAVMGAVYFHMYHDATTVTPPGVPEECTVAAAPAFFQRLAVSVGNYAGGDTYENKLLRSLLEKMCSMSEGRLQFGLRRHYGDGHSEEWNIDHFLDKALVDVLIPLLQNRVTGAVGGASSWWDKIGADADHATSKIWDSFSNHMKKYVKKSDAVHLY